MSSSEHELDPTRVFLEQVPALVRYARGAALSEAVSYRNFHVGASLVGLNERNATVTVATGWNVKPSEEAPKQCAEEVALSTAAILGIKRVYGIVIAGTSDPGAIKSVNGEEAPTLLPCEQCRARLAVSPIVDDDTHIIAVGTYIDQAEYASQAELDGSHKPMNLFRFYFGSWDKVIERYDTLRPDQPASVAARLALFNSL